MCKSSCYERPQLSCPPSSSILARSHAKELKNAVPKEPFFFLKPPSSILPPGNGPVLAPRGVKLHHEVELACIMGRTVADLGPADEEQAMEAIDGISFLILMPPSHDCSTHACKKAK